jgi:hypothetical protein
MMFRFFTLTLTLAVATAARGTEPDPPPAIALPDTAELAAFAAENWPDWGARLARFAGRTDQPTELVRVENTECSDQSVDWTDCNVTITARFADGALVTRTLPATFDRDMSGRLNEVIILIHPRPEPLIDSQPAEVPTVN